MGFAEKIGYYLKNIPTISKSKFKNYNEHEKRLKNIKFFWYHKKGESKGKSSSRVRQKPSLLFREKTHLQNNKTKLFKGKKWGEREEIEERGNVWEDCLQGKRGA